MKAKRIIFAAFGILTALSASNALASYTYTYTGYAFTKLTNCPSCSYNYTSTDHLEISITTTNPIGTDMTSGLFNATFVNGVDTSGQGIIGLSISDGSQYSLANTFTESDATLTVRTDGSNMVNYWDINVFNYYKDSSTGNTIATNSIWSYAVAGDGANFNFGNFNITEGISYATGTWVTTAPVPVPAAAWLLGSGLIGLVGFARNRNAI